VAEQYPNSAESKLILIIASSEDTESIFVIMDYFPGETLFKWTVRQHKTRPKNEVVNETRIVFKKLVESVIRC
jgi:hypothetical protein